MPNYSIATFKIKENCLGGSTFKYDATSYILKNSHNKYFETEEKETLLTKKQLLQHKNNKYIFTEEWKMICTLKRKLMINLSKDLIQEIKRYIYKYNNNYILDIFLNFRNLKNNTKLLYDVQDKKIFKQDLILLNRNLKCDLLKYVDLLIGRNIFKELDILYSNKLFIKVSYHNFNIVNLNFHPMNKINKNVIKNIELKEIQRDIEKDLITIKYIRLKRQNVKKCNIFAYRSLNRNVFYNVYKIIYFLIKQEFNKVINVIENNEILFKNDTNYVLKNNNPRLKRINKYNVNLSQYNNLLYCDNRKHIIIFSYNAHGFYKYFRRIDKPFNEKFIKYSSCIKIINHNNYFLNKNSYADIFKVANRFVTKKSKLKIIKKNNTLLEKDYKINIYKSIGLLLNKSNKNLNRFTCEKLLNKSNIIVYSFNRTKLLGLYKRWWWLNSTGPTDEIIIPKVDYSYKQNLLNNNNYEYLQFSNHPIPWGVELGNDLSVPQSKISIEILLDVVNIISMIWHRNVQGWLCCTGKEGIQFLMQILYNWYTLESSNPTEDYYRAYRWVRWYSESIYFKDYENGLIAIGHLIANLINYLKIHHFNVVPLWRNLKYMNEERKGINGELMKGIDKIKGKRYYLLEEELDRIKFILERK